MFDACEHNWLGELEGVGALISSLDSNSKEELLQRCQAKAGDLILFAVGELSAVNKTLDWLRRYIAEKLNIVDEVFLPFYIIHMIQTLWRLHRSPNCWLVFLLLVTGCSFNLLDYRLSYVWVEWFRTAFWGIWTFLYSSFLSFIFSSLHLWVLVYGQALHHPFTAPNPEDMGDLKTARALAYDLVYNGVEVMNACMHVVAQQNW